jgi:hypothetical protein
MALPDPARTGLEPLPNRFTKATALGCLGILGVFALPIFLLLPLAEWHVRPWLLHLLELAVFLAMAGGIWLLSRVPAARAAQVADPRHPITRAGRSPLVEAPATARNRLTALAIAALALGMMAVYVAAGSVIGQPRFGAVVAIAGMLGALCIALGAGIATGRLPIPAWRWARMPIDAYVIPQGIATCLLGAAALGWSLLAAAGAGYAWGKAGLALLVLVSVLLTPAARRWPTRARHGGVASNTPVSPTDLPPAERDRP